jgi:hypothetical protein
MGEERVLELFGFRRLRHFGKALQDLTLGEINILQCIVKQVVQLFFGHGQDSRLTVLNQLLLMGRVPDQQADPGPFRELDPAD